MTGNLQSRELGSKDKRLFRGHYLGVVLLALTMACTRPAGFVPSPSKSPEVLPTLLESSSTRAGFPRRFHVDGNAFVDQYGRPMVFRGISAIDPIFQRFDDSPGHSQWSEHYYRAIAEWCANIIRLPILPSSVRKFGMEKTLETLDQTIAWAAENKMYVIIDFHSLGWPPDNYYPPGASWYSTTPQEIMDFWKSVSSRYADDSTVAFYELYNEPVTQASYMDSSGSSATLEDWLVWKHFMDQVIASVRTNDPDKIIMVGGLQFAYDVSFTADSPMTGKNIAFTTHPYSHPNWMKNWNAAFGNLSSKYPVFATEFGYDQGRDSDPSYDGMPYHLAIVKYLEERNMSWAAWNFDASWQPTLLLDNFAFQPAPAGVYFRSVLLNLNQCR